MYNKYVHCNNLEGKYFNDNHTLYKEHDTNFMLNNNKIMVFHFHFFILFLLIFNRNND